MHIILEIIVVSNDIIFSSIFHFLTILIVFTITLFSLSEVRRTYYVQKNNKIPCNFYMTLKYILYFMMRMLHGYGTIVSKQGHKRRNDV
jgi:hypothetical protein